MYVYTSNAMSQVSKAMVEMEAATQKGDSNAANIAQRMVQVFTEQLEECNPILTAISDAMTAEADELAALACATDEPTRSAIQQRVTLHRQAKEEGQDQLKLVTKKRALEMKAIRGL